MRRVIVLLVSVVALGVAPAEAVSARDIIELSKGGLSDEILLALIEIDRRVYAVDPAALKQLKDAGVSERVILAMVRSGRMPVDPPAPQAPPPAAAAAPDPPQPQVIVIDHHDPAPRVHHVAVPVPVYVPVAVPPQRGETPAVSARPAPHPSIGLPHPRLGLSAPPPKPTSDPPYWKQQQRQP